MSQEPAPTDPLVTQARCRIFEAKKPLKNTEKIEGIKINPFPGLRPLGIKDKDYFYGRDEDIKALLEPLLGEENKPFVAVIGASGTGKSSLVGAGVLSNSRIQDRYEIIRFVPSDSKGDPIHTLASRLSSCSIFQQEIKIDELAKNLKSNPSNFTKFCQKFYNEKNKKILFVVDQFEELFAQVNRDLQQEFINLLLEVVGENEDFKAPFCILLTMRSEFYHYCIDSTQLSKLFNLKTDYKLSQPETTKLLEMIQKPSEKVDIDVEEVASKIIDDMSKNSSLPLMAYLLEQLYQKAIERGDKKLTQQDYDKLGGLQGVINQQAEKAFQEFSQNLNKRDAQDILQRVFFKLITIGDLGVVTRNKASREEVYKTHAQATQLVNSLNQAGLLTTDEDPITNQPVIEVAHEALFSSWKRLKTWLRKVREDLETAKKIIESTQDWKSKGKQESYLWSGDRLIDAHRTIERLASYVSDIKEEFIKPEIRRLEEKLKNTTSNASNSQIIELEPVDVEEFLKPEVERLEQRLQDSALDHHERQKTGFKLADIGDTRSGIGLRTDKLPDISWCKVPNGTVKLKLEHKDLEFDISESFYIAKYVVTYKQFKAFVDDPDGYQDEQWRQNLLSRQFEEEKQNYRYENYPRTNVSWFEAIAFCNWLTAKLPQDGLPERKDGWSIRLPTEWEWQLAASGGNEDQNYPWEDQPSGQFLCNDQRSKLNVVIAVGMYPHGQSPNGAFDFIGNGFEWCFNHGDENGDVTICKIDGAQKRAIRSCPWNKQINLKSRELGKPPQTKDSKIGFRIVYAPTDSELNQSQINLLSIEDS
ncbi:MAG: SUMF1/EgtB/PvdO family nonheme iron enzyme [Cyanothece sp. SIO1E1]|nr:SUMF1/EgtB/PvdO family nonheme iron enzyme [Cyanothece sp. SIO1E1]